MQRDVIELAADEVPQDGRDEHVVHRRRVLAPARELALRRGHADDERERDREPVSRDGDWAERNDERVVDDRMLEPAHAPKLTVPHPRWSSASRSSCDAAIGSSARRTPGNSLAFSHPLI